MSTDADKPRRTEPGHGTQQGALTSEEFIDKLTSALKRDGDFPANARVVTELRGLVMNPKTTANQITELILREPSLGTRILHLVNSSFYRRAKPIMTVSQAVVQIGMKPLADMCAGLVLLQKFIPAARSGGTFANCLKKTVVTSLLSSAISAEGSHSSMQAKQTECGYLAGSFAELGNLLLAFYFPQVYENAVRRSETKRQNIAQSIQEFTGLTPTEISAAIIKALNLPEFYLQVLTKSDQIETMGANPAQKLSMDQQEVQRTAEPLYAARNISAAIVANKSPQEVDALLAQLNTKVKLDSKMLRKVVGQLPAIFKDHCQSLEVNLPQLPEFLSKYSETATEASEVTAAGGAAPATGKPKEVDAFAQFVEEIRNSVESGEPTASIITTVMETMAWGLKFDRVLLLLSTPQKNKMLGRMLLGNAQGFDPHQCVRSLGYDVNPYAPDAKAIREGCPVFMGDPIIDDGWPIVALPIGFGTRTIGVIYADRSPTQDQELTAKEQAACGVLAELLDRSLMQQ